LPRTATRSICIASGLHHRARIRGRALPASQTFAQQRSQILDALVRALGLKTASTSPDHPFCAKRQLRPTEPGINNVGPGSHERNEQEEICYDPRAHPRSGRAGPEEEVMRQLHACHLSRAGRQRARYRAHAFNSDCHPFETGRSTVPVRARSRCLPTADLSSTSCSLLPSQSSSRARAVLGKARRLISLLSDTSAHVLASVSAGIAEHFRQLLDPVLSASGTVIEIEGLGGRLVRDAHAEPDDAILTTPALGHISTDPWRHPSMTLPWVL